jgi:predicted Zn-dependent peptidase
VTTSDQKKLTRSDIDAWLGRVHTSRNAALVVVGDVERAEVERAATILSGQMKTPAWVADVAAPPPVVLRAAGDERVVPVVTARSGALTDLRLACLLPAMSSSDAGHYDLLKQAVQARLNAALRIEHGDSYGVTVEVERLRGGTTYLVASTSVGEESLTRSLSALHTQWQRWSRAGFDSAEMNVARWRQAAGLPFQLANGDALAFRLLNEWSASPAGLTDGVSERSMLLGGGALRAARVGELFASCKANAVLGLTGNELLVRHALEQSWPALAARSHAGAP